MNHAFSAATLLVLWAAVVAPASAHVPQTALAAYGDGRFIIAATIAESEGSPDALAFAARARIADAIMRDDLCLDCLAKAQATAQAAIAQDPNQAEGYVQLAIAIGFRGRLVSTLDAQSEGLAEKGRTAIDRALELDPRNSWARASLGGWHLEIVHRAGSILASVLYDANEEEGLVNFRAALAGDPGSLLLHYHYALSILALDAERFRGEALATLNAGYKDTRTDALLAFTRKRTDRLMETLKTGSIDDIETLVHRYQGYPAPTAEAGAR
jgi:tetratricopeptide (TPR) repeat protein